MKVFVLLSAGSNASQPYLHIERYNIVDGKYEFGVTEEFLTAYLAGLAWIPKGEYMPFIQNAEVGEMILLKNMIAVIRLKDYEHI
jgi:hypothetical protein